MQLFTQVAPPELAARPGLFKGADKPFKKRLGGREHHAARGDDPEPNAAALLKPSPTRLTRHKVVKSGIVIAMGRKCCQTVAGISWRPK